MATGTSRTAIVTGASGGIGGAVAQRLARDGFSLVVSYAGNPIKAEKLAGDVAARGGRSLAVQADVAQVAGAERLFAETIRAFGAVDVVVHCAGIMALGPIDADNVEMFDRVIATNLRGTFLVLGLAAKQVATDGRIIAFSSSVRAKSFPGYGAYIASKAGVEGLVHVLANELRGRRISVNAVAPGPVATDLFLKGKTDQQIQELSQLAPLERLGQPEDIANVVSFLASPDGAWVNAQILRANGGFA
jgi:3-oxoacyl-[acyl-carrier protein] reductase